MPSANIAAVVLAAGLSRRFGGDKLLHPLAGRPLAAHIAETLAAMPFHHRIAVCPPAPSPRIDLFSACGFGIVTNPDPQRGMGSSLALAAARALELGAEAMLVCLADMPAVTAAHLQLLLAALDRGDVVATEADGTRSPPVAFAARLLPELTGLTGDQGARHLLQRAAVVAADPALLRDFDTPTDFA